LQEKNAWPSKYVRKKLQRLQCNVADLEEEEGHRELKKVGASRS
jgi:hypothetical protein